MIEGYNENQAPWNEDERVCPNCGEYHGETMIDHEGTEGCPCCMAECQLYNEIYQMEYLKRVIVRTSKGWERGLISLQAKNDEDYAGDWKPEVLDVFEAIASCIKPLTVEEKIELNIL